MHRRPDSPPHRVRSGDAGDTLVELLVALAIISICVVGLIGGLVAAVASSGTHRNLTSLDTAVKNFADLVRYEVQLQPATAAGATPLFARCAPGYLVAGVPNPPSGPVGTAVTAFGSGFSGAQNSVSITTPSGTISIPNALTGPYGSYGNVTANFTVPALPAGTYPITINGGGTAMAATGFTVTPWLGALSASSGPVGTPVTVPVKGFNANASLTVTVGGTGAPITNGRRTDSTGSASVSFAIPGGLPNGPQPVVVSDGTNSATATFSVGGVGAGPPGVASPIVSSSPLADYQVGISSINYWNGTSFPQPAWTPSQCVSAGSSPNQDIQQIIVTGSAPGATDQLSTVVSNPQYVPTPAMTTTLDPSSTLTVGGQVVFDAKVTGPPGGPSPATGTVNWQIAVCTMQGNQCVPSGQAAPNCSSTTSPPPGSGNSATWTCTLNGSELTANNYTVTAVYSGNSQYNSASSTISVPVTVQPGQPTIAVVAPSPVPTYGQSATFVATVSVPANAPAPQGAVTWSVSGQATSCDSTTPLSATAPYQATCTINRVTVGTYSVTATVAADANYNTATSSPPTQLVVPHLPTTTSVTADTLTQTLGGTIQFTATVTGQASPPLTGAVTWSGVTCASQSSFTVNGTTGTETCDVLAATAGNYTATATYGGDPIYASSNGTNSPPVQVTPATPSVTVTPSFTGGTLTFTATVAGPAGAATPTPNASWSISGPNGPLNCTTTTGLTGSGNPQGTATATCGVTQAPSGPYTVTYSYNGDNNYNTNSGSTGYTVPQATPTVVITANLHRGTTLTFSATVSGPTGGPTPTGTGTWTVAGPGGVSACSSTAPLTGTTNTATATCTLTNPPTPGDYIVSYSYPGDGNYNPASAGPITFHVPGFAVTFAINGQTLMFTATLTLGSSTPAPTGTVNWTVSGGATSCSRVGNLSGGGTTYTATCSIRNVTTTTYNARANFGGDANYVSADAAQFGVQG